MSLQEAENLIKIVENVVKSVIPRNQYEVENMYMTNMERLTQARRYLNTFTGAYPESILNKIHNLESKLKEKHEELLNKPKHDAFDLEFEYMNEVDNNQINNTKSVPTVKTTLERNNKSKIDLTAKSNVDVEEDLSLELANQVYGKKVKNNSNNKNVNKTNSCINNNKNSNNDNDKTNINKKKIVKRGIENDKVNNSAKCALNNNNLSEDVINTTNVDQKNDRSAVIKENKNKSEEEEKQLFLNHHVEREEQSTSENVKIVNKQSNSNNSSTSLVNSNTLNEERKENIIRKDIDVEFIAIPLAALVKGGFCMEIENSPLIDICFNEPVNIDTNEGLVQCICNCQTYKCIWLALAWGEPLMQLQETTDKATVENNKSNKVNNKSKEINKNSENALFALEQEHEKKRAPQEQNANWKEVKEEFNNCEFSSIHDDDNNNGNSNGNDNNQESNDHYDNISLLSEQLVAKYDASVEEELVRVRDRCFPQVISADQAHLLRQLKTKGTWVILLCHGGCFAGGVYVNGKCVIHKAFQRYVIRKKQGGMQSNFGDSSAFHSAGSMIRAAQELKWKTDVRDILLSWESYIKKAHIILYAAPGPHNRAILTDFSQLPQLTSLPKHANVSPINLSNKNVWNVPFTTHKPSYKEVERIYDTLTRVNITYKNSTQSK